MLTFGEYARTLLYNARGRHEDALGPAQSASSRDELMVSVWSLPELVEAAARSGRWDVAHEAVERLTTRTQAAGTQLALGRRGSCPSAGERRGDGGGTPPRGR